MERVASNFEPPCGSKEDWHVRVEPNGWFHRMNGGSITLVGAISFPGS